jgi:hypothetical protein
MTVAPFRMTFETLRAERDALRRENEGLRQALAAMAAEKRALEVARDIATRAAVVTWLTSVR